MNRWFFLGAVLLCAVSMATGAYALSFDLEIEYAGGTEPEGPLPWLTATITDRDVNSVELTMAASGLVGSEFVDAWYFNVDPIFIFSLDFVYSGDAPEPDITQVNDRSLSAGGSPGFGFDLLFDFPQAEANRFETGETATFLISSTNSTNLTAGDFDLLNQAGNFYTAAHVQSIGTAGGSGWIAATEEGGGGEQPIPESSTLVLLGVGLFGFGVAARKKFNR